ncbi:tryptorubin family RiPP precursor [Kitasatospora sp. NPDC056184]|uniref:tryptorubin family RiPP precursor n=1 Tax=Kitasatospora sp. NPDC056184 TaxID=3345738 RepID=UPI0035D93B10
MFSGWDSLFPAAESGARNSAGPTGDCAQRGPSAEELFVIVPFRDGGAVMKLVHFVKKVMPEKSLKAYAWYGWI